MKVVLTLDASPQLLAHLVHAKILLEIHLVHFLILEQAPQLLASVIEDLAHLGGVGAEDCGFLKIAKGTPP
jgi:hypothetical protein